jgi:hypothetical protein
MTKTYWLHLIPLRPHGSSQTTAQVLLVGNEYPHPGGAAPSRGYLSWEQLRVALQTTGKIEENVLQQAEKELGKGVAYTIANVELDEAQIKALGLNLQM